MFDSILTSSSAPRGNLAGLGLSALIAIVVGASAVILFKGGSRQSAKVVDVMMVTARPAPPPPPPAGGGKAASHPVERKIVPRRRDVVEPKVEPEHPPTPALSPPTPEPAGQPGGVAGGVAGGVVGGVLGGVVGGVPGGLVGGVVGGTGSGVLPFGEGMTRPQLLSGGPPEYTAEARAARVEGKVIVRCTITISGEMRDCKIIKGVPILNEIVLSRLHANRYTPVMFQGRPQAVQYLLPFNFKLP